MQKQEQSVPAIFYELKLSPISQPVGYYTEVTGLSAEIEVMSYNEGGRNDAVHKLPTRMKHPNLVLKRGVTAVKDLQQWTLDSYMGPARKEVTLIALLARLSLGERPSGGVLAAIGVGFLGVLVVLAGELQRSGSGTLLGIAAAMAAAASYAIAMVSLKARAGRDPIATIVLLQNGFAALLVAPFGVLAWSTPTGPTLIWFALIGLLGTAGHVALTWAYGRAEASRLGAIEYTAFVWATALGIVFFGEIPSLATLAGAALIIGGAIAAVRARSVGEPATAV